MDTSKNNAHTPGPWHIGSGNGEGSIFADSGRTRLEIGGTTLYPICQVNRKWEDEEDEANARLIAAAPDMLQALKDALEIFQTAKRYFPKSVRNADRFNLINIEANSVRNAIAKATAE